MPRCRVHHPQPVDTVFFAVDAAMRAANLPGTTCQSLIRLEGSVDIEGFRRAILALYAQHPVANARRVESGIARRPLWRCPADGETHTPALFVHELANSNDWLNTAAVLLDARLDPCIDPPVQWHVLRGAGTGDAVITRWTHTLMDAKGVEALLDEIQRLYVNRATDDRATADVSSMSDPVGERLNGYARSTHRRLLAAALSRRRSSNDALATLARVDARGGVGRHRCAVRTVPADAARRMREIASATCGWVGWSAYQTACGMAALRRVCDGLSRPPGRVTTRWLFNLRRRRCGGPIFRNCLTYVPLEAGASQTADRDAMARTFAQTLRPYLTRPAKRSARRRKTKDDRRTALGADAQFLSIADAVHRLPFRVIGHPRVAAMFLADPPALPMSQMGTFGPRIETFCGARIANYLGGMGTIPPKRGYNLLVNEHQGKLNLMMVYLDGLVDAQVIDTYLEALVTELGTEN